MIKKNKFFKLNLLMLLLIGFLTVVVFGQDNFKPVADEAIGSNGISWIPKVNYSQLVLTISRPDGTVFRTTFDSGSSPYIDLANIFGSSYQDGSYTYELVVVPSVGTRVRGAEKSFPTSRTPGMKQYAEGLIQSGSFTVKNGGIITPDMIEPSIGPSISTNQEGLSSTFDQVIADDLIVQMSACIGNDCVNNENFGFDTLRLKENNLRIHFDDTSNSGSFPYNDWRITINDSANGGASYFRVDDATNNKSPFTIEANAGTNTLYVDSTSRVGIGTSTPVVKLHVTHGDTPALRLEQNNSLGWTPQTWDVAGNETNFFIRDVTHSSHLPFRIKPSAPENSLFIAADGSVGLGTEAPDYPFEVKRTGTGAQMVATRTDGAQLEFSASGSYGIAGTRTNHPFRLRVDNQTIMDLSGTTVAPIITMADGLGSYNAGWNYSSSRELKENIKNLTTDEAMETLAGFTTVKYNYKIRKGEQRVGFIAEDVPDLVASKDRKTLNPLDIVAVLTKVVQEQQKNISKLEERIAQLEKDSK